MVSCSVPQGVRILAGVYRAAGRLPALGSLDERLRLQREAYLFSMHPDLAEIRGLGFTMYVAGPYSPALARAYDRLECAARDAPEPPPGALEYAREILGMDPVRLEAVALLAFTCEVVEDTGQLGAAGARETAASLALDPEVRAEMPQALEALRDLAARHGLRLPGPCAGA
ncbi:MAG: hypothetical protein RXN79_03345 [Candidatus Nanopusillus sp.]